MGLNVRARSGPLGIAALLVLAGTVATPARIARAADLEPAPRALSAPATSPGPAVTAISAGFAHTCALLADHTAWCWGNNYEGQLGDGTGTDRLTPVAVSGISTATAISAGDKHTCALLADGTVLCWGHNDRGQLGDGTTTDRHTPVKVSGIATAAEIDAGGSHTCALLADHSIRCWGYNGSGSLGDGTLSSRLTPVAVIGVTSARTITAGWHTCAVLASGSVRCWGWNDYGQLGDGTVDSDPHPDPVAVIGVTSATAVASANSHTCALLADRSIRCWGSNDSGQLGDEESDPYEHPVPVEVDGISTAMAIAVGYWGHTCAVLADRSVACWGSNNSGQLGDGTRFDSPIPVAVSGITTATAITAGGPWGHTCAVLADGSASCWGFNDLGQLGDGTTTDRLVPVAVVFPADATPPSTTAPAATPRSGAALAGSAIPVALAWSGSDAGGSGIARYELAQSTDGGSTWTTISSSLTTPDAAVTVPASGTIRFRVRAVDGADNTGAWATGRAITPRLAQESSRAVRYRGTWTSTASSAYSGGSAKYARVARRSATYSFTGRSIALVTTWAPTRGKVKVYVNGSYVATVDLRAAATTYRVLAWQKTWATSGTRTVRLVVAGTSGRPRVDLDAFAVLR